MAQVSPRYVAMATTDDGFRVAPYLRILHEAFQLDDDNLVDKFRGLFGFKVKRSDGTEGFWLINTKEGKGKVEFNSQTKPDVTFIVNDADVMGLIRGDMNPQKAFFAGKIKVQGNMGVAMKLTQLQPTVKAEIEKIKSRL